MKKAIYLLLISFSIFSCKKDDGQGEPVDSQASSVIIGNEGNFPDGVSSVTLYDREKEEVQQDVYQRVNGSPIGSTLNDILVDGDRVFFVVNGTGSIVVAKAEDLSVEKVFKNLHNVRNIVKTGTNKYYVSSWDVGGVYVLDMAAETLSDPIETGTGPTRMLHYQNWVFVTNSGGYTSDTTVSIINTETEAVVGQFAVGDNPNSLQLDAENNLWVLCSGVPDYNQPENSTAGSLHVFSLDSLQQKVGAGSPIKPKEAMVFDNNKWKPTNLLVDNDGGELYFLNDGVEADIYKIAKDVQKLPAQAFIKGSFYAMDYDPVNHELYASNPLSYTQSGEISRFSATDGNLIDKFSAGLIPGSFAFK